MAQLVSTTCTSLSVAGSAVWTAANSTGQGSGIDADRIGGYNPNFINPYNPAQQHGARWIVLETLNTGAGALSTFYPYIINGARNADGTCGLDIRRTSLLGVVITRLLRNYSVQPQIIRLRFGFAVG
jgi:hypothetical protein